MLVAKTSLRWSHNEYLFYWFKQEDKLWIFNFWLNKDGMTVEGSYNMGYGLIQILMENEKPETNVIKHQVVREEISQILNLGRLCYFYQFWGGVAGSSLKSFETFLRFFSFFFQILENMNGARRIHCEWYGWLIHLHSALICRTF